MLYLYKRQYLKNVEAIMFKKFGLTVLLILVSFSLSYAGNVESSNFLMDHGFKVTDTDQLFMINKRGDNNHPLLMIAKLPSQLNISDASKSKLLEVLNKNKMDKSTNFEYMNEIYTTYEENIKNQSQRAYVLTLDVNFDGLYDLMICPDEKHSDMSDSELIKSIKKYSDNLDLSNKHAVHFMYHCYSKFYSLMPMFKDVEFNIAENANIYGSKNKFSSSLYNIHNDDFAISKIKLISNPDGNFTLILKDENNDSNPREINLQTNIKWN